jgi:ribosomal protein S18 acetylase RimI-like enzyme
MESKLQSSVTATGHFDMNIRVAGKGDISRIIDLLKQIKIIHHAGRPDLFSDDESKFSSAEIETILSDEKRKIFVSVDDNDVVNGYIFCQIKENEGNGLLKKRKTLWIEDFCVDEDARGSGIGKMLFKSAEEYAIETNCDDLTLNVWGFNDGAKAFYEACGMTIQRIVMEKKLK